MIFANHRNLENAHAILSPSKYHWINYDAAKMEASYRSYQTTLAGTRDHEFASMCIKRKQKLPSRPRTTMAMFVNDAIGFDMASEQVLCYSRNCFGTTDAIQYHLEDDVTTLRIHDLKTGKSKTHMEQLRVYAAIFCLEYGVEPIDIRIVLRIYQNCDINEEIADPMEIKRIMDVIVAHDMLIENLMNE